MTRKIIVVAALAVFAACQTKIIPIPDPIRPNPPRVKIEPTSLKFRIAVFDFVDQTGMAGGVVQTGGVRNLVKSGNYIISPPEFTVGGAAGSATVSARVEGGGGKEGAANMGGLAKDDRPQGIPYVPIASGGIVQSIPDALSTALYDSGRFDLYDVGQLRNRTLADTDKTMVVLKQMYAAWGGRANLEGARRTQLDRYTFPDAILTGAITSIDARELIVDLRLVNFASDDVMFATNTPIKVTNVGGELRLDREDVRRLVMKLVAALPSPKELKKGQIVSREGNVVTVNLGKEDRLIKGMNAFVVSYGDKIVDPSTGDTLGDETFLGEIFVFSVYPRTAKARIYNGAEAVRVGDYVVFK